MSGAYWGPSGCHLVLQLELELGCLCAGALECGKAGKPVSGKDPASAVTLG